MLCGFLEVKNIWKRGLTKFSPSEGDDDDSLVISFRSPLFNTSKTFQDTQRNAFWLVLSNKKTPKSIPLGVLVDGWFF